MWCPNCNLPVPLAWIYCPRCGAKLVGIAERSEAGLYPESEKEAKGWIKRKAITIEITDKEVDALEDIFFCKLSEEQWKELSDAKHSLWKKIATAFDFEETVD